VCSIPFGFGGIIPSISEFLLLVTANEEEEEEEDEEEAQGASCQAAKHKVQQILFFKK